MSIKLEIFAETTEEYFSTLTKLLAGSGMPLPVIAQPAAESGAGNAVKPAATRKAAPAKTETTAADTATDQAGSTPAQTSAPAGAQQETTGTTSAQPDKPASEQVVENEPAAVQPKAETKAAGALDYDRDVAPKVLAAVKSISKEFVVGLFDTDFGGVSKADQIPSERWPELVAKLEAGPVLA